MASASCKMAATAKVIKEIDGKIQLVPMFSKIDRAMTRKNSTGSM